MSSALVHLHLEIVADENFDTIRARAKLADCLKGNKNGVTALRSSSKKYALGKLEELAKPASSWREG